MAAALCLQKQAEILRCREGRKPSSLLNPSVPAALSHTHTQGMVYKKVVHKKPGSKGSLFHTSKSRFQIRFQKETDIEMARSSQQPGALTHTWPHKHGCCYPLPGK